MPEGLARAEEGTFQRGDTFGDGESDEKPVHPVTVSGFYIEKYEVTFDEYDAFCTETGKSKPSDLGWGRGRRPVIYVSWCGAAEYCNWLSRKEGLRPAYSESENFIVCDWTADGYRLPTEAEWELQRIDGDEPPGAILGDNRVNRGGSWYDVTRRVRSAYRDNDGEGSGTTDFGFRVGRS